MTYLVTCAPWEASSMNDFKLECQIRELGRDPRKPQTCMQEPGEGGMKTNLDLTGSETIPRELTGALPRRLRPTGTGISSVVIPTILALAIGAALWGGINAVRQSERKVALRRDSGESVGEVTRIMKGKRSDVVYYTFTVNDVPFTGNAEVPGFLRYDLRESKSLAIRYLHANPDVNHPASWEWSFVYWQPQSTDLVRLPDFSSELLWLFASLILGPIGLVFFIGLRRERILVAEGAPATAVVKNCSRGSRGSFLVEYEFRTEGGEVITGSCSDNHREIGTSFCILYLPQNPQQNMRYPSPNYRAIQE